MTDVADTQENLLVLDYILILEVTEEKVGLPSQTSRTKNKRVISTFKFVSPHLTLKEGSKGLTTSTNSQPMIPICHCGLVGNTFI